MTNTHNVLIRDGAWLQAQTFPPMRWVVPDLVPEGMTILAGSPKVGKSWLVLSLALGLAAGGKAFGSIDLGAPRPVLYCALEDGDRRLQKRSFALLGDDERIPGQFHYTTKGRPFELLDSIALWLDEHRDEQPVVIVDTLAKIRPPENGGENAYERDYRHAGGLKALIDPIEGGGLIAVHHVNKKGDGDFVDAVSGTNGIAGAADTTLVLRRNRTDDNGVLAITGRDVLEAEYAITQEHGTWTLAGGNIATAKGAAKETKATRDLGPDAAAVVEHVLKYGPISPKDVAAQLQLPSNKVRVYITRALDNGRISRHMRGKYGPPTTTSKDAELAVLPFDRNTPEPVACVTSVTSEDPKVTQVTQATTTQDDRSNQ